MGHCRIFRIFTAEAWLRLDSCCNCKLQVDLEHICGKGPNHTFKKGHARPCFSQLLQSCCSCLARGPVRHNDVLAKRFSPLCRKQSLNKLSNSNPSTVLCLNFRPRAIYTPFAPHTCQVSHFANSWRYALLEKSTRRSSTKYIYIYLVSGSKLQTL